MKNNETCNAPKCLKPTGLIDWVNCNLCKGWVHTKCANLTRTEARNLSEFKCAKCFAVNTAPLCDNNLFRPEILFNSSTIHLKRVPKNSRIPLAENLIPKINDICQNPSDIVLWCILLSSISCFLEKPSRGGKRQKSSLSAIINKRIRDGVRENRTPKRDKKPHQKSELDQRIRSICTKLDEGNVKAGIRMAVGDDKIADFTADNYAALMLKHPQKGMGSLPDPTNAESFQTSEYFVHKALMSFPNGSSAGLDGIAPQILKDLTAKSNGQPGLNFLKALTSLVNVILEGKVPDDLRPYFFGAKLIALKKPDGGLRPIAIGNTLRRLTAKCAGYHVFESRQARYGSRQVGVGTKRGAELASHVFRTLVESTQPKENIILKIDFENAFNSVNRQYMLEKTFQINPDIYKYSHSAYSQPSYLFYGESVIKSSEGTQQGDPESPALFSDAIQDMIDSMESKINLWYLDDGNLSDDYRTVLKDLKKIVDAEKTLGLKIKPTKCEIFFLGDVTEKRRLAILTAFQKICPGIKTPTKDELIILGSPLGSKAQVELLEKKIEDLKKVNEVVQKLDAHYGFYLLKNCLSLPKLLYFLRTSTCFNHQAPLEKYDKTVRDGLSKVCNVNFDDISCTQVTLPAEMGGLGVSSASLLALPAFLASAFGARDFLMTFFSENIDDFSFTKALEKWLNATNEEESPIDGIQKNWTQPIHVRAAQDLISRMNEHRAKIFNAHQGRFGSQWLNVVPCKNLGLKLDDQQLRISIGLRLGANICIEHTCHCGKKVERDGLHGLSCNKSAGRFSRHANLNSLIKQTLGSLDLPSMLEPRGLYRTDGKRPDGITMIPWEMGKQLVWDVTVVDALAPSRINQGSLCNPGTTATDAEARKSEKYRELIENGYIFQPVALEVQGSLGESSEVFIARLCKMLCRSHDDQRAGSFLKQRISMALQVGNAACVLGTVSDRDAFEEIYYL